MKIITAADLPIYTVHNGKARNLTHVQAVEAVVHLINLKEKSGSNPWPVIDAVLDMWRSTQPKEYQSFLINLEETRQTRFDQTFGASKSKDLRYKLDIPQKVIFMLRTIYTNEELPMDKAFFDEWFKRYKKMRIAERQ